MKRSLSVMLALISGMGLALAQAPRPRRTPKTPAATAEKGPQPKYKAIWEPVNYPVDAELKDVYFATPDEGWVAGMARSDAGEGGLILHTKDGGQTWTVQAGDPHSADRGFRMLRFLDAKHGWVLQYGEKLLRTSDGENWEPVNSTIYHFEDYRFVSPTTGVAVWRGTISQTQDGGRTWNEVYTCQTKVEVQGLMHDVSCDFVSLYFPSPTLGYAVSSEVAPKTFVVAKTVDSGATWSVSTVADVGSPWGAFFTDENTGVIYVKEGGIYRTTDGGNSWKGVPGERPCCSPKIEFADSEVGWMCIGPGLSYTTDAGKRWTSRELRFPAGVNAFSFPRRDRAYVVGDHGMIYRYRIVPIEYTAKGMIDAPMMPPLKSEK